MKILLSDYDFPVLIEIEEKDYSEFCEILEFYEAMDKNETERNSLLEYLDGIIDFKSIEIDEVIHL